MEPRARIGKNRGQQSFSDAERLSLLQLLELLAEVRLIPPRSPALPLRPRRLTLLPRPKQTRPRRAPH